MTFNPNANISNSNVRSTGGGGGGGLGGGLGALGGRSGGMGGMRGLQFGGGGIVMLIVGFIVMQLFGVDVTGMFGGGAPTTQGGSWNSGQQLEKCKTGEDANNDVECRMQGGATSLESFWGANVQGFQPAQVLLFSQAVNTGCGQASSAVGPFYCPEDQRIYIDTTFFNELQTQFGAEGGSLAELYVLAHEYGHHIQNLTGVFTEHQTGDQGPTSNTVRSELQADCYAGAWIKDASSTKDANGQTLLEPVTKDQLAQAVNAASVIGDDTLQKGQTGQVNQESFTHGSSEQRQRWLLSGYNGGIGSCNTWDANSL